MKHILRFGIVLVISLLGEILSALIPLTVPASIYGMLLMLGLLMLKIVPLEAVKGVGGFLTNVMPLMFVPAAVGLMDNWAEARQMLLPLVVAIVPVTFIVMAAAGGAAQALIRRDRRLDR